MRELTANEIMMVSGGSNVDPMDVAISYSSTVIGAAVGLTMGGPVGGIVGAAVGFGAGMLMSYGYGLATGPDGSYVDDGMTCQVSI